MARGGHAAQLTDEALKLQRDTFVYRAYLAQVGVDTSQLAPHANQSWQGKFSVIKSEIRADAAPELQAIKNASAFLQGPSQRCVLQMSLGPNLFCVRRA